jgi:hypothetical protein
MQFRNEAAKMTLLDFLPNVHLFVFFYIDISLGILGIDRPKLIEVGSKIFIDIYHIIESYWMVVLALSHMRRLFHDADGASTLSMARSHLNKW